MTNLYGDNVAVFRNTQINGNLNISNGSLLVNGVALGSGGGYNAITENDSGPNIIIGTSLFNSYDLNVTGNITFGNSLYCNTYKYYTEQCPTSPLTNNESNGDYSVGASGNSVNTYKIFDNNNSYYTSLANYDTSAPYALKTNKRTDRTFIYQDGPSNNKTGTIYGDYVNITTPYSNGTSISSYSIVKNSNAPNSIYILGVSDDGIFHYIDNQANIVYTGSPQTATFNIPNYDYTKTFKTLTMVIIDLSNNAGSFNIREWIIYTKKPQFITPFSMTNTGNLMLTGPLSCDSNINTGNLSAEYMNTRNLSVTANINVGNLSVADNINANNLAIRGSFTVNGNQIKNYSSIIENVANSNVQIGTSITPYDLNVSSNITCSGIGYYSNIIVDGNISVNGNILKSYNGITEDSSLNVVIGSLTTPYNLEITQGNLSVNGDINSSNINVKNIITPTVTMSTEYPLTPSHYSNLWNGYESTTSYDSGSTYGFMAFDNVQSTYWESNYQYQYGTTYQGGASLTLLNSQVKQGEWIMINLGTAINVTSYTISIHNSITGPHVWYLLGSNTGINGSWVQVDTQSSETWSTYTTNTYECNNTKLYSYYALLITQTMSTLSSSAVRITRWSLTTSTSDSTTNIPKINSEQLVVQKINTINLVTNNFGLIGYDSTMTGCSVTQQNNKSTAVTLNMSSGIITMSNGTLNSQTRVNFRFNNNLIKSSSQLIVSHISGGSLGWYLVSGSCSNGYATIYVTNLSGSNYSEALVLRYTVLSGADS